VKLPFSTRLWLALRVMRGNLTQWSADTHGVEVRMNFEGRDRSRLNTALTTPPKRSAPDTDKPPYLR
jgi:hypothetical protein